MKNKRYPNLYILKYIRKEKKNKTSPGKKHKHLSPLPPSSYGKQICRTFKQESNREKEFKQTVRCADDC